jgi:hypothetical protein
MRTALMFPALVFALFAVRAVRRLLRQPLLTTLRSDRGVVMMDTDTETSDTWVWIGWGVMAFLATLLIVAVLFRWF